MRGASALERVLQGDSTRLSVVIVWEHVTVSDRKMGIPTTKVLARISDARARQFWDEGHLLSRVMVRDLPPDTLRSVAEVTEGTAVAWDCVALFRPGVRWEGKFPVPDWAGRPVVDVIAALRQKLAEGNSAAPISKH